MRRRTYGVRETILTRARACHVQVELPRAHRSIIDHLVRAPSTRYKGPSFSARSLTTLAFWLRSSVVSVLKSLTTFTEALLRVMVIQFLSPLLPGLCLQPGDAMTLPLHYWPVSSGDFFSPLLPSLLAVLTASCVHEAEEIANSWFEGVSLFHS